ncbi:HPr family phosphocarrier protein [Marinihelvus fidelis]|uniref:HPr family phosphocarrier protein n=1 Tax=Marinihelvus fidelis TaxID=2613842 RepID=A0A5N0TH12_9GAMM|nr:HPr family phosphocarrier protein [Marinihelvus fidelis]KAA9133427.1 HPr family phosphocarrier protein [Marinihelvus fidelis]
MPSRDTVICNELGLHARAAARLVECANRFDAAVHLTHGDRTVNGKSIMGVLMLAAARGTTVTITTDGADEGAALDALGELVNNGFGEN